MDIFKTSDLLDFWPTAKQSARDRALATARFIIYATIIIYLLNRDSRVFALGALALGVLYYMWSSNLIADGLVRPTTADGRVSSILRDEVTRPTLSNPMGNILMNEYTDNPDRPPAAWYPSVRGDVQAAWSTIHPFERVRDAERNFYTTASTTIPNDQNAFATAAYGKQFAPMCKDQGGKACDPDNFQFHFPEVTQMRGGNGGGYGS